MDAGEKYRENHKLLHPEKIRSAGSLVKRIESRNGLHTLDAAEDIGLGSRYYKLVIIE